MTAAFNTTDEDLPQIRVEVGVNEDEAIRASMKQMN
jgi:hypothetical protein